MKWFNAHALEIVAGLIAGMLILAMADSLLPSTDAMTHQQKMDQAELFTSHDMKNVSVPVTLHVVTTKEEQLAGLSKYKSLAPDEGMLFVYPNPQRACMWAKDMTFPLSVAFMDAQYHILNIEDMAAGSEKPVCSNGTAKFALEMNLGWFKTHLFNQ